MKTSILGIAALAVIAGILTSGCRAGDSATADAVPEQPATARPPAGEGGARYVLGETLETAKPALEPRAEEKYPVKDWDALLPADWDPMKAIGELDLGQLSDSDPRAMAALRKLQAEWKDAPVNAHLDNTRMKIAGFVVPLDTAKGDTREFLLVPYFGACIHTPPPPSNQVIHVLLPKNSQNLEAMNAIWVSGALSVRRNETALGSASYSMTGDMVEPYTQPSADRPR